MMFRIAPIVYRAKGMQLSIARMIGTARPMSTVGGGAGATVVFDLFSGVVTGEVMCFWI